jgi:ammonium transporter, Amt family
VPNKGDTAWMLTCTAFVLLMAVPALTLFYGGLVRTKNMLSVLMQVFVGFSLITVLWCVYGDSLAFTAGNAVIGSVSRGFLSATFDPASNSFALAGTFSKHTPMYERVYVALQATFAAITCCLILGALVERIKFSGALLFLVLWFTFSYLPVAHVLWFWAAPDAYTSPANADAVNATAGLLWQSGALDFAGGTMVHVNAEVAGLLGAFVLGKRIGFGRRRRVPAGGDRLKERRSSSSSGCAAPSGQVDDWATDPMGYPGYPGHRAAASHSGEGQCSWWPFSPPRCPSWPSKS